ncbi:hypothetical protein D3H65_19595 [Paraflavitalea soli]|uniref:Outer membrane protein beta-barrel domain-containing protein n=2 Tax=Paraflavitalea soli TaxID=2315862 RepID=A0A3B7MNJ8_9BACT|nr:hypothetical protein D3H65_19595 [Paraflavitalea soli]
MASWAQNTTHIGAEVAYSNDFFKISDPAGRLTQPDINSALWGVNIRRTFNKKVFLETGIYARAYKVGLAFDHEFGSSGTDRTGYLVPLRAGIRLPILKGAVTLCPVAGVTFGVTDEGYGGKVEGTRQWDGVETIRYSYTVQYPSQVFALFQAGAGIDIRLWPKTLLCLSTNFYGGISKIMMQRIEYVAGAGMPNKATQHTNGGFYTVGVGFKYEVNWF